MGWYHSHPISEPKPSQQDILAQKSYQVAMQLAESGEEPCIGLIISRFAFLLGVKLNSI